MEEQLGREPAAPRGARSADAVRGSALSLLIFGAVCLYFGLAWLIDAPASAGAESARTWFAVDRAFQWLLRLIGTVFLLAAAYALSGRRGALLLAAIADTAFVLLMVALAVETTLETRADGRWDPFVILFVVLAIIGAASARRTCRDYALCGTSAQPTRSGDA